MSMISSRDRDTVQLTPRALIIVNNVKGYSSSIATMSTTDILLNSAALHSLKRNQLVSLCKTHGLKGSGKSSELISKLQEYAMNNPTRDAAIPGLAERMQSSQTDMASDDTEMRNDIEQREDDRARIRPSEVWEVIEEETMEQMRQLQEESLKGKGSLQSNSSKGSRLKIPGGRPRR